jgi:hypothetical protein
MLEVTIHHADIPFLSGFPDDQIVGQLLSAYNRKFPVFDRVLVTKDGINSITCDFFQEDAQVARIKVVPVRFS